MAQQIDIVANLLMKVDGAEAGINKLKSSLSKLKMPEGLENSFKKSFSNLDTLFAKYRSQVEKGFDTKGDVTAFNKTSKALDAELTRLSKHFTELTGKEINFKVKSDSIIQAEKQLEKLVEQKNQLGKESLKFEIKGGKDGLKDIETLLQKLQSAAGKTKTGEYAGKALDFLKVGNVQAAVSQLDKASASFKRLKQEKQDAFKDTGFDMGSAITAIVTALTGAEGKFGDVNAKISEVKSNLANFQAEQIQDAGNYAEKLANDFSRDETAIRQADGAMQEFARSSQSMSQQLGDLQQSTQYFFSLRNMINLFKRGIDDAIQSVKELDAAMTETAVVTDYKVSDMWNMLPQYTQLANQLGATTQGAYETMTLYFQQGLDQQQAFELGAETMKMARIAGLDYAETTDMMTAALRGFNMELNETSAKRVNDVYSELAAITASDTEELGTAMQRTASIAHSAGSSFEGTTAFLAQAIETTREPAENIGTAMKTIIARFQEMKKNPLEISEVDGEEVDFNKIDAALKTIGVDLVDTNGQFRDFDKVMLDISSRWDTLSQSQQRYIATVAAGSRQQSRFIAMVSDYDRTMELMEAANNSAGASDEQFSKTMDSLESKLNKLHNAWQQFTMGIANNNMIKLAVDGITGLLTNVNKLIDTFSLGIGPVKSFLSIFTAFTGLKAIGKVANAAIGGLGGMIDPQSTFSAGFGRGFLGNRAAGNAQLASQINQPIVAELRALRTEQGKQIKQNQQNKSGAYDSYNQFKTANQQIRQLTSKKGYKVTQLKDILGSLDKGDQNQLMRHMSGTIVSTRSSLMNYYQKQNPLAAQGIKQQFGYLNNQRKIGELSWKEYYDAISDPELLKRGLDTSTEAGKAAERMLTGMAAKVNQKVDSAVRSQALSNLSTNEDYNNSDRTNQQKIYQQEVSRLKADAEYMTKTRAGVLDGILPEIKNSKWAQRVDSLGKVSAGITSAGMGIQSFGNLLISSANPALQAFGSTLVSIGGVVSNLGMGLGGLVSSFSAVAGSDLMGSIAKQIGIGAGALTAGLGIAAAAIAGIAWHFKKQRDEIRKNAEKVTTDYKEKNEQHQSNISNLASYREDFARLSAGVDANGMNINLNTADYERYLEITKAIASINPEIVDGYNAQGNAIISNKNALEETLAIEKERQSTDFNNYIDSTSTEKLIAARNLSRQSRDKETFTSTLDPRGAISKNVPALGYEFAPQAEMRKQAQKVGKNLQTGIEEGWAKEDILADFNIDIADLVKGSNDAVQAFEQNYDQIKARVSNKMDSAGDELKDKTKESMLNAFSGYNEASDELNELITPLYEQQLARIGKSLELPNEFKSSFNQGLKEIVSDANITDVEGEVNKLAAAFSDLSSENSEYSKILQDITDAQDKYAETLNKADYDIAAKDAKDRIEALKTSLSENMDLTQGYGKAISEFLDNEINKIENFTEAGAANIQHALNTMTDQIAAAEGALENFNSIAEGSTYGKAASNMSQIFETATADEHVLGEGDQAFWAGAEALVGRGNLLEGGDLTKDKALAQMKEVQKMLKGGQEGWDNFKTKWFANADANFKVLEDGSRRLLDKNGKIIEGLTLDDNNWIGEINEDLNPQVYEQVADALNMSKDSLIAMLNLGRQFGEVDFTNVSEVRKALATSDTTIKNADNGKVFVKQESLESEMTSAGIALNKQQEIEKDLQDNYNTELIKSANEITKANNQFAEMGITSMESLVKTFDDTGQFTKDEIRDYAEKWAEFNGQQGELAKFDEYWKNNQQDNEFGGIPGSLDNIQGILSSIESILASQRLSEGYLDNPTADASKKWLFGGAGEDTAAQKFWKGHGTGVNGEITASEFNQTSKELTDFIAKGKDYIAQLDKVKPANETERKQIEAEKKAYEYQVDRANTYLKEGTEAYNTQVQNKIDAINQDKEIVDKGFADLLGSITPESINTDAAQSTLNQLYEAAINNTPAVLTDGLMSQMQNLGIDIQKAIDAGLIVDTNGVFTAAEQTGKETAEAGVEGNASGQEGVDTTPAKAAGEQKGKETGQAGVSGNASGQSSVPHQAAPGMPSNVPQNATAAQITVDNADANAKLDETQTKASETAQTISQGADFSINVTGADTLSKAAADAQKLSANAGAKTVGVKASFDGSAATSGVASINGMSAKIKVGANTTPALTAAEAARKTIDSKSATINVSTSVTGQNVNIYVTKHVKEVPASTGGLIIPGGPIYRARGGLASNPMFKRQGTDTIPAMLTPGEYVHNRQAVQYFGIDFMRKINHKDLTGALQSFGSAAKGQYGRLGPNGKGGLTLTGEEGFEVAWIPSENRSMILGMNGPQMTTLPADAIIWDHKQSKKIMSQNAIPAGSHYVRGKKATRPGGSGGSLSKSSKKSSNKSSKKSKSSKKGDSSAPNNWSIEEVVRFDIDRKLETLASKIKKATDDIDKKLSKIGLKASGIAKDTQAQVKNLQAVKNYNDNLVKSYQKDLNKLDTGGYKTKISYDTGSGKKKKSKEETINLSNYIYRDGNGDYQIDRNAIAKAGSVAKQEAIFKAAESALNPLVSGLQKAKDAAADAQKQMDELGKKVSETFYQWENDITEVYNLTQRISHDESLRARFSSQIALQLSKLKAGFGDTTQSINIMHRALERDNKVLLEQIENHQKMIGARQRELNAALSAQDELDELNRLRAKSYDTTATKNATVAWATDNYEGARLGRSYLNNVRQDRDGSLRYDIDWARFEKDRKADPYNKNTYEAIKKYLEELNSATDEFNKSIQEQTDLIKETYDALREYRDYVADFEDTLLKGFEEEIENNIDNSKRISESISNTLKDLLDQVKRKLDERRQQEDNRKTEDDISRKQQRLAMLRADTSGGHAAEIAQLESEIADSQQSYQRTLEDQLLDKLQQQGDEAAKQRERQIEIAQAQLEVATNGNSAIVDLWLRDPEAYKEEIKKAWLEAQGYDEKGEAGQYILASQFESEFANLVTAIDQSGFSNGFKAVSDDTNTLVNLLTKLTEGRDTLTDSLSKAVGALQDVENRDTHSFELGKRDQLSAADWKKEGQTAGSLKNWGYTFNELKKSGFTNTELKNAGFGINDFKASGITSAKDLKASGFTAANLKNAGYTFKDLLNASFSGADLKGAGFSAKDFKQNNVAYNTAKSAGFDLNTLRNAGYSEAIAAIKTAQTKAPAVSNKETAYKNTLAAIRKKGDKFTYADVNRLQDAANAAGHHARTFVPALIAGDGPPTWRHFLTVVKGHWSKERLAASFGNDKNFVNAFNKVYGSNAYKKIKKGTPYAYKTGGLNTYTGPAWLDGTPSKPELVLNATDTKNFIALKDVLSRAMSSTGQINNSYSGNATYEININVDHLNNDYDVDRVVERVKKKIVQDAGYRNVTQVRKFR